MQREVICTLAIPSHVMIGGVRRAVKANASVVLGKEVRVMLDVAGFRVDEDELPHSTFALERGWLLQRIDGAKKASARADDDESEDATRRLSKLTGEVRAR